LTWRRIRRKVKDQPDPEPYHTVHDKITNHIGYI
jgi:hypothetical protein